MANMKVALCGCVVSCSQLPKNLKESIREKVQLMGGVYSVDLTDSVTHLICGSSNSEKYRLAVRKGVLLMLPTWIDFLYESSRENNVNCRDKKILDEYKCPPFQNLTICATGLTNGAQKTRLMEIVKANGGNFARNLALSKTDVLVCYETASGMSEKYKSARRVPSIWCVTPDWIHDSAEKGYAMPHDLEKYRVKTATSTPTKDGEKVDPNFSTISAVGQSSMCQRTRIDETVGANSPMKNKRKADDLVELLSMKKSLETGLADGVLTKEVVNFFMDGDKTSISSATVQNVETDASTQKYLDVEDTLAKMLENQSKLPSAFQPQNTSTQISQATTDLSEESSIQMNIFDGLEFTLQGFDDESYKINKHLITSAGGMISTDNNYCDYAIVPIIHNPRKIPATKIVNESWLQESLETATLITDIQYYHEPISATSANFLEGCVISISVYANYEREFLKSLIVAFGGLFQEQFSKKSNEARKVTASTHLIIPEASGKKYEAAVKWNLPVITKDWLLACARAGEKLPWQNYSVTNEDETVLKTPEKLQTLPTSQVTPINKILQDAIDCKVLPTPPSPKQYFPWDPKTPDTPLGAFYKPNPSPWLRKEMQKYVNSFPDFVPPKRRNSTPLSELKRRLRDKAAGRGEYSRNSETNNDEAKKIIPQKLTFEQNNEPTEDPQSNIENTSLLGTETTQSQANWDNEEEKTPKKVILLSGITDRDRFTDIIISLGAECLNSSEYVPAATHLICLKPGRNEKTLCCIAAGKWILHVSYLEKSEAAGRFLDEEEFEFGNPKAKQHSFYEENHSCIHYWRQKIAARGYGAFHDMRAIIIAEKKELLANVVQAGGGAVVDVEPPFDDSIRATHCLMEMKSVDDLSQFVPLVKQGIKCVNTIFINDFLWKKQNDLDCIVPYFTKYYK